MAANAIDERYDEIVRGLRALSGAPAELRGRVLEAAAAADVPRLRRRGLRLAVVVALLVVALVAAIALTSGGSGSKKSSSLSASLEARPSATPPARARHAQRGGKPVFGAFSKSRALGQDSLPITPGRLTDVHASLRLRV